VPLGGVLNGKVTASTRLAEANRDSRDNIKGTILGMPIVGDSVLQGEMANLLFLKGGGGAKNQRNLHFDERYRSSRSTAYKNELTLWKSSRGSYQS